MSTEGSAPCELAEIVHEKPLSGVYDEVPFGTAAGNTLWVKFSDRDGIDEWIGIFGTGTSHSARVDKVLEPDKFLISAGGFGYVVDATKRQLLNHHTEPYTQDVAYDATRNRFIVADYVRLRLIESGKVVFSSKRIALDGIRNLRIEGRLIYGLAMTDYVGRDHREQESEFTFNLDTLEVKCPIDLSAWDDLPVKTSSVKPVKSCWKFW
jgi:hypothetical protein